jgi:hypothetical protein
MIQRREFLSKSAVTTAGLVLSESILNQLFAESQSHHGIASTITGSWKVNPDGSFDLNAGSVSLQGCYPAIDGVAIKPIAVEVSGNSIKYKLVEGVVNIALKSENGNGVLSSSFEDIAKAPHWFQPLAGAKVMGLEKFFHQGIGFAGPSGFANINKAPYQTPLKTESGSDETWLLESYLTSGLVGKDGNTLAIAALDHRNYLQKSSLYNREQRWGLINRHLLNENICFQAEFSTEEIALTDRKLVLPDLHFVANTSAWDAFTTMAQKIAKEMNVRPAKRTPYHWCSWYIKQREFSYEDLSKFLEGTSSQNPKPYFQTVQIDDGYSKYYGDWLDFRTELWPGGIKPAYDLIKQKGYAAGIWIGPFMVGKESRLFAKHPEWCLKKADGNYIEEFGGKNVILDTTHPEAFSYIRSVFRYMKQAGCTFYKTDFMDWGLQDSVNVKRHTTGKTSVQNYREVLKMIREEIGDESYWLACISPFPPFLGFADGIRVANDTSENWGNGGLNNVYSQMQSLHYGNNILFQNDPDVMYLNNKIFNYTDSEIRSFAYFCGIIGGSVNTSEWLNDPASVKLWRFLAPSDKLNQATLPFLEKDKAFMVAVRQYKELNAWGILVTNISEDKKREGYTLKELTGEDELFAFQWDHNGSGFIGKKNSLEQSLGAHESVLYFVSKVNKAPAPNMSIGGKLW